MKTYTGWEWDPANLSTLRPRIRDISWSLAHINRFNGNLLKPYSVAHHSLLVAKYIPPKYELEALLHDAAEAYTVDMPSPVKDLFPEFKRYEMEMLKFIFNWFDLTYKDHRIIHHWDHLLGHAEVRDMQDWNGSSKMLDKIKGIEKINPLFGNKAYVAYSKKLTKLLLARI